MQCVGIIAGGGALPRKLVEACKRDSRDYFVLGIKGQTDAALQPNYWTKLGATTEAIAALKAANVDTLVMAGYIRRPTLAEMKPDWRTVQVFARLGTKAFGDDALLRAIASELEKDGFSIIGAHEIDPSLVTPQGVLGKMQPKAEHQPDIDRGIFAAKELGRLDIGQAVVVQQGIVLGVEAIEGTDALLERCRKIRRKGRGGVLVKTSKPQQDKRLDLPAIGLRTVRKCFEAGIEGIAVEAGASLILEREEVIEAADKLGIFVTGFNG